jgi:xanthine dehydrogenase small subunit
MGRDTVRFLLGDEPRALSGIDPTLTVLEYLRGSERLSGTKEGCAEGDCGACTVVLGEASDGRMRYQAVNACILFVPALDGRQLITVEHLRGGDGDLHPVQQAMVDHHGSQCGFCTPGFVMSLFAMYHEPAAPARPDIDLALAGNLCRCTGYRPIVAAAVAACTGSPDDGFTEAASRTAAQLADLRVPGTLELEFGGRKFYAPDTVDALADLLLRHPDAVILAGGTDVGLWVTKQHRSLDVVVSLEAVRGLADISRSDAHIRIGARASYEDALDQLGAAYPDMGALIRRIGARQVRNRGTIGGNVANGSPIGDSMPALIALGASVVLRRGGEQRTLALEDLYLGYRKTAQQPGEFVERVDVPLPTPETRFAAYKISKRSEQDISAVCAAFRLELRDGVVQAIRIGLGGVAATPLRAVSVEHSLAGRPWTEATVREAMAEMDRAIAPISDMRSTGTYRATVARNLLYKFYLETAAEPVRTRLEVPA